MELLNVHKLIRTDFCFEGDPHWEDSTIVFHSTRENEIRYLKTDEYLFYTQQKEMELYWKKGFKCSIEALEDLGVLNEDFPYELMIVIDTNRKIIGYVTLKDLAREMKDRFQNLEAYFHTIIDTIDNSVSVVDREGKTIVWTKGAENIFSIQKEDILGKDMKHFFPKEMLLNEESMLTGKTYRHHLHKPREDLFVLISTNPVVSNGEIIGAVAAETDVTSHVMMNRELLNASSKIQQLQHEVSKLNDIRDPFQRIKGSSSEIKKAISLAKKMAKTKENVLLLGETGVGKEVFAKSIHDECQGGKPFIALNCGALSPALFESELFGYEKGSFSGGDPNGKIGKVELAGEGTLLLDEVGDLPLDLQVKLLRVLENKTYYSVGGLTLKSVRCRVIAATNKNLDAMVENGDFREDLYYRLNTLSIEIPPLRKRKQDILELFHLFIYESSLKYDCDVHYIAPQITQLLLEYDWKGNIRELKNVVDRMVLLSEGGYIMPNLLPEKIAGSAETTFFPSSRELEKEMNQYEKRKILETLESENGNKTEAAKRLGITRATLYNKMKKLNIDGFR